MLFEVLFSNEATLPISIGKSYHRLYFHDVALARVTLKYAMKYIFIPELFLIAMEQICLVALRRLPLTNDKRECLVIN